MTDNTKKRLVLFDLDGTLIPWDTQLLFFNFIVHKNPWRRLCLIPFVLCLPLLLLHIWGEGQMKRLFLAYLAGMSEKEIKEHVSEFVKTVVTPGLYPEVLAQLKQHQNQGDLCLLVSASPTIYAKAIGEHLGFHETLASDTMDQDPYPFYPVMPYGNNKGETKVVRLRALGYLPPLDESAPAGSIVYSDSRADLPMLQACARGVLVNPSASMQRLAKEKGWQVLRPTVPWSGKMNKIKKILQQFFGLYPL